MKLIILSIFVCLSIIFGGQVWAQLPPVFDPEQYTEVREVPLSRKVIPPQKIVWVSDNSGKFVKNQQNVLEPGLGQADLNRGRYLTLVNDGKHVPGIILDFGKELQGGIEIVTSISNKKPAGKVRVRFGESVAETMSDTGENSATNDHAMRDFEVELPWLGRIDLGQTGFRFVRIDLVQPNAQLEIKEINGALIYRDIPYLGSFKSNDDRLNEIWLTGAYTVHLNMQEYLWDGIKRDRLVWVGDLHPEVMTVNSVFGYNEVVPKSLDLARDLTPLPGWMNGISSYSMWWIILHRDWYKYQGDLEYLKEQQEYHAALIRHLATMIDKNGKEVLDGNRFLDWPSSRNKEAVHAGLQAMMAMAFEAGAEISEILGDDATHSICVDASEKLKKHIPSTTDSKQAAALLALSGLISPDKANREVLSKDGAARMSTFYGYYMLQARALAGDYQGAIDNIREYWGGMLDLGATTFWEDFNVEWLENAARIDEVVPVGKVDVHGDYGDYCYVSYRHSLCHGWASGPTAWLTEHVLGVKVLEPGGKKIKLEPHLGDLEWVEGTFPTAYGVLEVRHERRENGNIKTTYKAPKGVKVVD
ncbi:MAG TPA: alpha-L-rhamnosidase C-terminal domain-containing protein [Mariniphaga sp.]|nr:alpha-L-rhamnosidase C-terminal domain-containing protein [Mariniphaga sp.]